MAPQLQATQLRAFPALIRTILVPLDFSGHSQELVASASRLAQQLGASLRLLHVFEPPAGAQLDAIIHPRGQPHPLTMRAWLEQDIEQRLPTYEAIAQSAGVTVGHQLEFGHPSETILRVAKDKNIDLIFMGTHGRTGLTRAFVGSVAEEVIRHADLPVLTLRLLGSPEALEDASGASEAELQVLDEENG